MLSRRLAALLLFVASTASAQFGFEDNLPKVTITGTVQKQTGDTVEGVVSAAIAHGWHINS